MQAVDPQSLGAKHRPDEMLLSSAHRRCYPFLVLFLLLLVFSLLSFEKAVSLYFERLSIFFVLSSHKQHQVTPGLCNENSLQEAKSEVTETKREGKRE